MEADGVEEFDIVDLASHPESHYSLLLVAMSA